MPLELLAIVVAAGLAVVIGAVHLFGGRRSGTLDEAAVRTIWAREGDGSEVREVVVCDGRAHAVIMTGRGDELGFVRQMGAHAIARTIRAGEVKRVAVKGARLTVRLYDTTLPKFTLNLNEDEQRGRVERLLRDLSGEP